MEWFSLKETKSQTYEELFSESGSQSELEQF
jgi:hypothetical protein